MILIRLVKTYDSFESCMSDQPCNLIVEAECVYSNDRGTFQRTSMELRCDVPLAFPVSDFVCSGALPNDQGDFADRAEDGTIVVEFSDGYVGYRLTSCRPF